MSLQRAQARNNVVALLTGATRAGSSVLKEEPLPIQDPYAARLPHTIGVYLRESEAEELQHSPLSYRREGELRLELVAPRQAGVDLVDDLEAFGQEVEDILLQNEKWEVGGIDGVERSRLEGASIDLRPQGLNTFGMLEIRFGFDYETVVDKVKPATGAVPLEEVYTEYDTVPEDPGTDFDQLTVVPQDP